MSDVEKIYCTEPSGMGNDCLAWATMMNNNNQWNNNPFMYLVWMMFANRFWGNGYGEFGGPANSAINTAAIQDQIAAFRNQVSDNQNSNQLMDAISGNGCDIRSLADRLGCDYNALSGAIGDVRAGIDRVAGQLGFSSERVINAVNLGDANIVSALKDCCCQTKTMIQEANFQNQLATERQTYTLGSKMDGHAAASALQGCKDHGDTMARIDKLASGISEGFSSIGYQNSQNTNSIITAINAAQQRTSDQLSSHWTTELSQSLQDAKFEISQLKQNQYLSNLISNGGTTGGN